MHVPKRATATDKSNGMLCVPTPSPYHAPEEGSPRRTTAERGPASLGGRAMAQTIFERCGGFASVRKIVSAFYDKVLDSPVLQKHFAGIDMRTLLDHQTKFIAYIMGDPASYSDEALRKAHAHLGITASEFGEMARLLGNTLEEFDLDSAAVEHVMKEIARREPLIVARKA